jgi:DNA-binding transcriptional regulator YiaG
MSRKKKFHTEHADPLVRTLEDVRSKLKYSQLQMAQALGVPFRTYQKWVYLGQQPRHGAALLASALSLVPAKRVNCWEVLNCGREPNGVNVDEKGLCPAALDTEANGVNSGTNGGRVCWAIAGTFCGKKVEGSVAARLISCLSCDFFTQVLHEEGLANFRLLKVGQTYTQD